MTEKDWERKLREEGFTRTFVWRDGPGAYYPEHTHQTLTAHIVLDGEMTLTSEGNTQTFKAQSPARDLPARAALLAVV